ncbi:threonine synthase [Clostridium rectalis]|uniref:threonine synthase n=1 Tax=Clostridium rectalis TaxID=2040295 RepID=UPI000F643B1E|nr:threonine synthase [Clostridium rectalis]
METLYKSTRGKKEVKSSEAILNGICDDGGLYVPINFPNIDKSFDELSKLNYKSLAVYVLKKYLSDFDEKDIRDSVDKAYDEKFSEKLIAPINKKGEAYFLELYHGPTLAFKDMALSLLPYLLKTSCRKLKINKEIVILTATSGDTGKAALEAFSQVEGVKIIVFFPENGVSDIQKRQMITQEGDNTFVIGINGNFDHAQSGVKEIFNSKELNSSVNDKGYILTSANSINIGRLLPQIIYYIYSYAQLVKNKEIESGENINIVVPTGNFGNILAAYYAKNMGLPVNKLICASNENNVLTDFFNTGIYNKNRNFKVTISPSMDILISSNLERLIYEISNHDEEVVKDIMKKLIFFGKYELGSNFREKLKDFYAGYVEDRDCLKTIKDLYEDTGYLIDTHTAVAYKVYKDYKYKTKDLTKTVIASTASPFKFTRAVCNAIGIDSDESDDFKVLKDLSLYTNLQIPKALESIYIKNILHKKNCNKKEMKMVIKEILNL